VNKSRLANPFNFKINRSSNVTEAREPLKPSDLMGEKPKTSARSPSNKKPLSTKNRATSQQGGDKVCFPKFPKTYAEQQ